MQQSELDFVNNLRQSSPYIEAHQGKTIVIYIPSELLSLDSEEDERLFQLAKDVVLLNHLGMKTVITLGVELQLNEAFERDHLTWETHFNCRVTTKEHLKTFVETIGQARAQIESEFTEACSEEQSTLTIISGNWVTARPKGIIQGIDFQHTGALRKINHEAIARSLSIGQVVLLTPLTYSLTGEMFNLNSLEQAFSVAKALEADKLMIFSSPESLVDLPKQMSMSQLNALNTQTSEPKQKRLLSLIQSTHSKIKRIHLLDQNEPGAILLELFTRDGVGTMIFTDRYHHIRPATFEDVSGILMLIAPLEEEGILVKRSREKLELEIENFVVIARDDHIIGCAALYPMDEQSAEMACLAIDPAYQGQSLGEELLQAIEKQAMQNRFQNLFLLTTHTDHWFIEHGFKKAQVAELPAKKQSLYNYQRQSKVLVKALKA